MTSSNVNVSLRQAPNGEILDHLGASLQIKQLWQQSPVLLQFARHLGCPFCREQAKVFKQFYPQIQQHGVKLAMIIMGTAANAKQFAIQFDLPFSVYADPNQSMYQAFEVPRGNWSQIAGPQVWLTGLKAVMTCGLAKPSGDLLQLQATYLIDQEGNICWQHLPKNSADHPELKTILEQVEKLITE